MKRIQDLYFGVLVPAFNKKVSPVPVNLFDIAHIRYYAAKWRVAMVKGEDIQGDPAIYVFGDVWSRAEYEFLMRPLGSDEDTKIDLYQLYVVPQREHLFSMIEDCSVTSARTYIREYRKAHPTK